MDQTTLDITLCGGGFATWMTALALRAQLSSERSITVVETPLNSAESHLYGYVLPPNIYQFHLQNGISEPDFLLNSTASFCLGTEFHDWGTAKKAWVQAFHHPLPVWDGVAFSKIIAAIQGISLQDCLISASVGRAGRFAHPPEEPENPLSRAEYGYHFDPDDLCHFYREKAVAAGVISVDASIEQVQRNGNRIKSIILSNESELFSDLFVDLTGSESILQQDQPVSKVGAVSCSVDQQQSSKLGSALREVRAHANGWSSSVRLRGRTMTLHIGSSSESDMDDHYTYQPGFRGTPWVGNCVALGLTAHQILPLTLTPIKLLLKDIERLLKLIPVSASMDIEAREYNRSSQEDRLHATLFDDAHYVGLDHPQTELWGTLTSFQPHLKLERKLGNFMARGYHVAYDHEAYDELDWAVLHDGLGRMPAQADTITRALDFPKLQMRLKQMRGSIAAITRKIPPHDLYMEKFLDYLERKQALNG